MAVKTNGAALGDLVKKNLQPLSVVRSEIRADRKAMREEQQRFVDAVVAALREVSVNVPQQAPPVVEVKVEPQRARRMVINRGQDGLIKSIDIEEQ